MSRSGLIWGTHLADGWLAKGGGEGVKGQERGVQK